MSNPGDLDVIPIPKHDNDFSLVTLYPLISCQSVKVIEAVMLTTVNTQVLPSADQHGFRPGHSTTCALLQLTNDVATCFNQRKPPHRTICIAVDLTATINTFNHNVLLSKIVRSTLPEATCPLLLNYISDRQSLTSHRGVQ